MTPTHLCADHHVGLSLEYSVSPQEFACYPVLGTFVCDIQQVNRGVVLSEERSGMGMRSLDFYTGNFHTARSWSKSLQADRVELCSRVQMCTTGCVYARKETLLCHQYSKY